MKDCGCCAVCLKKKSRPLKGKTSKAHQICVSKSELLSYVSEDDNTESNSSQLVQDASVLGGVGEHGDESGESVSNMETTAVEIIDIDADSSVSTKMPVRDAWKRFSH